MSALMIRHCSSKVKIIIFVTATYLLTFILNLLSNETYTLLSQFTPAIIAIVLLLCSTSLKDIPRRLGLLNSGHWFYYFIAFLLPLHIIVMSYIAADILGFVSFNNSLSFSDLIYYNAKGYFNFVFLGATLEAIGEEIGWRGYLQPKLAELIGIRKAVILTGVIWAVWHYSFIFTGKYFPPEDVLWSNTILFTTVIILKSIFMGWLLWSSKSLWTVIFYHAATNAAWRLCTYNFTVTSPYYTYIADESGVFNVLFWAICAAFIWRRLPKHSHLSPVTQQSHV
jgi:membrane protease YdiL (CAAX protease family)